MMRQTFVVAIGTLAFVIASNAAEANGKPKPALTRHGVIDIERVRDFTKDICFVKAATPSRFTYTFRTGRDCAQLPRSNETVLAIEEHFDRVAVAAPQKNYGPALSESERNASFQKKVEIALKNENSSLASVIAESYFMSMNFDLMNKKMREMQTIIGTPPTKQPAVARVPAGVNKALPEAQVGCNERVCVGALKKDAAAGIQR